ncbi:hypothetical protein ACHAXS_001025 [Conticribra weissflogii]
MVPLAEKAALILQEGQAVENLCANNLTILLRWWQVPKATEGKVEVKRKKWQDILESKEAAKIYKKWSDEEEAELNCLKSEAIDIADTALGRLKKENMNQMKATIKHMTKEEKEALLQELQRPKDEPHKYKDFDKGAV